MNETLALEIVNKIFRSTFDQDNIFTLDALLEKFAFDVKLPQQVNDSTTGETTWADSVNANSFITNANMEKRDRATGWMLPRQEINSLREIIDLWQTVNYFATERVQDSINVTESDTIYGCENIYRSTNCGNSKNLVYCDSCGDSDFLLASQRSVTCNFCIRTDDSKDCSSSCNVIYSNKVSNSLFIQDCFDLHECMFCSHIASKRFCIANMQFEASEYRKIKQSVIKWVLDS